MRTGIQNENRGRGTGVAQGAERGGSVMAATQKACCVRPDPERDVAASRWGRVGVVSPFAEIVGMQAAGDRVRIHYAPDIKPDGVRSDAPGGVQRTPFVLPAAIAPCSAAVA